MKTETIKVRVSPEEKKKLAELSDRLRTPASEIVRELILREADYQSGQGTQADHLKPFIVK